MSEKASPLLLTERLVLRLPQPDDAEAIARHYDENRPHLGPWEPVRPPEFYTAAYWRERAARSALDFQAERSIGLFLFEWTTERIMGSITLFAFMRGPAQLCKMGYGLAEHAQGHGYMTEALQAVLTYAFGPLNLHRIEANYRPGNARSGAVLKRLGFTIDGYTRDYLFMGGVWHDHIFTSLTNAAWRAP